MNLEKTKHVYCSYKYQGVKKTNTVFVTQQFKKCEVFYAPQIVFVCFIYFLIFLLLKLLHNIILIIPVHEEILVSWQPKRTKDNNLVRKLSLLITSVVQCFFLTTGFIFWLVGKLFRMERTSAEPQVAEKLPKKRENHRCHRSNPTEGQL